VAFQHVSAHWLRRGNTVTFAMRYLSYIKP